MKIKQSTFYGFQILNRIDKGENKVVTSREIAEKEDLSQGMILRILQRMEREGLVYTYQGRGGNGGSSLAKSIDGITFLEVVKILEGIDICVNLDTAFRQKEPQMFWICSRLNEELEKLLAKYTVRDLFGSDNLQAKSTKGRSFLYNLKSRGVD